MREYAKGEGLFMEKERLERVLSGLNRYKLTQKEDQFVKSTEYDFNQKNTITEQQEEKLTRAENPHFSRKRRARNGAP